MSTYRAVVCLAILVLVLWLALGGFAAGMTAILNHM